MDKSVAALGDAPAGGGVPSLPSRAVSKTSGASMTCMMPFASGMFAVTMRAELM